MVKAVIFDMDGVIIDSEPLWRRAELEVFGTLGLHMEEEMLAQTTGLGINEAIKHWYGRMKWEGKSVAQVVEEVLARLVELIKENSVPAEGTHELIEFFRSKHLPVALASSSPYVIINTVIDKFGVRNKFDAICSAEGMKYGKPHPEIYIAAAEQLGIEPFYCLAIEDSINGLISAKAARMKCIVMPGPFHENDKRLELADKIISSLKDINKKMLSELYEI